MSRRPIQHRVLCSLTVHYLLPLQHPSRHSSGDGPSGGGPSGPKANRGLPGLVRSRINSRIICTNRGCRPGVSARTIVRFKLFAKLADFDVEVENNLHVLVEESDRHDHNSRTSPFAAIARTTDSTSGSSHGCDGGPLRLWKASCQLRVRNRLGDEPAGLAKLRFVGARIRHGHRNAVGREDQGGLSPRRSSGNSPSAARTRSTTDSIKPGWL